MNEDSENVACLRQKLIFVILRLTSGVNIGEENFIYVDKDFAQFVTPTIVCSVVELQKLMETLPKQFEILIYLVWTESVFRLFCCNICEVLFHNGYSSLNFLIFLSWTTCMTINFKINMQLDFTSSIVSVGLWILEFYMDVDKNGDKYAWEDLNWAARNINYMRKADWTIYQK